MSFLEKILSIGHGEPATRVRVCPECGMAVENHKDWCSIFRARQAMAVRKETKQATA